MGVDVVVVGGSVLDVHLTCDEVTPGSTSPGKVAFQLGGVGRNIAECLGRLGQRPLFISAVGQDAAGQQIISQLRGVHVQTRGIRVCPGQPTPTVACCFDGRGNLRSGVADTGLLERELTGEWVARFRGDIESAKILLLEANLTLEAIEVCVGIAHAANVPVFFEPVSVHKSVRVVPFLSKVAYLSPNEAELGAIVAQAAANFDCGPPEAMGATGAVESNSSVLHALGVKHVLVTRGEDGVYASSRTSTNSGEGHEMRIPSLAQLRVVNVNGAGDCLVAGLVKALVESSGTGSLEYAVSYGIAVACAAIQSEANVPRISNPDELDANAWHVFSKRKTRQTHST